MYYTEEIARRTDRLEKEKATILDTAEYKKKYIDSQAQIKILKMQIKADAFIKYCQTMIDNRKV